MSPVAALPTRYDELIARFPLRPIRSATTYDAALAMMNTLLGHDLDDDEDDYLHVLGFLIREYDEEHHALPVATPADLLRDLMDEQGISLGELAEATGVAASDLAAMLANRRGISKRNCRLLGEFFKVPATRFLR